VSSDFVLTAEGVQKIGHREVTEKVLCFEASEWNSSAKKRLLCCPTENRLLQTFSVTSSDYLSFRDVSAVKFHSEFMLHNDNVVGSVKPFDTKYCLTSFAADCLVNAPVEATLLSTSS